MTVDRFITTMEMYFGEYRDFVKRVVFKWLSVNVREVDLERLSKKIIENHSNQYGVPPDVAVINKYYGESSGGEMEALNQWNLLNRNINSYASIICEDAATQAAVEGMGGWVAFCCRSDNPSEEVWAQKRFLELYSKYHGRQIERKVLKGLNDVQTVIVIKNQSGKSDLPIGIDYDDKTIDKKILDVLPKFEKIDDEI